MDLIEVYIKLIPNNQIYSLPIRKSETILKLKEYCKIISKIPQDQQDLLYKGQILLNEKFVNDYNIENNDNMLLVKKEEPKPVNIPINQNSNILNKNIKFSNNNEINANDVANAYKRVQAQDILSFYDNIDLDKLENYYKLMGVKFSEIFGIEKQEFKELLKDPKKRDKFICFINMAKDPSMLETLLKDPIFQAKIKNSRFMKISLQNPQLMFNPQNMQAFQTIFKKDGINPIENSSTEISNPPEPIERLNNSKINQMKNSSHQMPNINTFNNNSNINKENFINSEIRIDYKEKYKEELSKLYNMGFMNEETSIQALKQFNGNIENAINKLLERPENLKNDLNSIGNIYNIKNINLSNNNEINYKEMANRCSKVQIQDMLSLYDNIDLDKFDNFCKLMGVKFSDFFGMEKQEFKELLKNPEERDEFKNMINHLRDPSILEMTFKHPEFQARIKNNHFIKMSFQNPQLIFNPQNMQAFQAMFKKDEINPIENSSTEIFKPPEPFERLNNSKINQMKNSSHQMPNINSFNNDNNINKENFINNEIRIDYKEKYKEELSKLKNMGFKNDETSIQALEQFNGNIENAINKILDLEKNN